MPPLGMCINLAEDDAEVSTRRDAFLQGLGLFNDLHVAMGFGGGSIVIWPIAITWMLPASWPTYPGPVHLHMQEGGRRDHR
jgi:hypothetical protein